MKELALELAKARIGISTTVRDEYLSHIVDSVIKEMEESHGIELEKDNSYHLMFVVDFADWRYSNRDKQEEMPRHLQFRLHNMILKEVTKNE